MEGRASRPSVSSAGRARTPGAPLLFYAFPPFFFSDGSHDIIARNCSPTFSIGCCFAASRRSANFLPPCLFSSIHSLAKRPFWICFSTFFIALRVASAEFDACPAACLAGFHPVCHQVRRVALHVAVHLGSHLARQARLAGQRPPPPSHLRQPGTPPPAPRPARRRWPPPGPSTPAARFSTVCAPRRSAGSIWPCACFRFRPTPRQSSRDAPAGTAPDRATPAGPAARPSRLAGCAAGYRSRAAARATRLSGSACRGCLAGCRLVCPYGSSSHSRNVLLGCQGEKWDRPPVCPLEFGHFNGLIRLRHDRHHRGTCICRCCRLAHRHTGPRHSSGTENRGS